VERFWEIVARHRISSFSGVPTLYAALLRQPLDGRDISSLRYAFCGAAPMPPGLLRRFEERTGVPVLEGYGLTEGTCVSTLNPFAGERRPGSVGLPLPFQRLRPVVLGPDGAYLRDAEEGEAGAVAIAGPNVFPGYLAEADDAGIWIDRGDGLRWLDTGDLGRVDGDGYLWLTGRRKELIIRGGHNIDPAAIEEALQAHPAVELAAAVGRPDAHAGEVPVAYVQLRPGTRAGPDELRAFADSGIGERAAVPVAVRVVEVMPLTAVGKIFKPRLKEMEAERVVRGALDAVGLSPLDLSPLDLSVASDARRGTVVRLRLREAADAGAARHALASYALAVDIAGASEAGPTPP
jgi:fatty-acyl-CoA synthase